MSWTMVLFGVLPLIVFVLLDSLAGLRAGLIGGMVFAVAEVVYSLAVYQTIDGLTIGSASLVVVLGGISYVTQSPLAFKMQPLILGLIFGGALLVSHWVDKPLLVMMAKKYQYMFPKDTAAQLIQPGVLLQMARLNYALGWGFLVHALCVGYAAFYMSNWWWIGLRGIGLYVMMAACAVWIAM